MSRTDEKGAIASREDALERGAEDERDSVADFIDEGQSQVRPIGSRATAATQPGGHGVTEESQRTRLIADITRLIGEPSMPEHTRHAGLTLIGWLARRKPGEAPHSIGIDEARESERRIMAARAKTR